MVSISGNSLRISIIIKIGLPKMPSAITSEKAPHSFEGFAE